MAKQATDLLVFYTYRLTPHQRVAALIPNQHKELMAFCMRTLHDATSAAERIRCLNVCSECAKLAMDDARNKVRAEMAWRLRNINPQR